MIPKYFIVLNDGSKEFKEYIAWLNKKYTFYWQGNDIGFYYGYDGNEDYNGTDVWKTPDCFKNSPAVFNSPKEFLELLKQKDMKEIIGYECPMDLFGGEIKKGTVYIEMASGIHYRPKETMLRHDNYCFPKEIVETWQPVYKEEEIKLCGKELVFYPNDFKLNGTRYHINELDILTAMMRRGQIKHITFEIDGVEEQIDINFINKLIEKLK